MDTLDAINQAIDVPAGRKTPSGSSTTRRKRGTGIALMLTSSASNQAGAALGAMAFPTVGPVGVVAVRQLVTALVLTPIVRPKFRGLRRDQWLPILGLVVVFSVMNLSLYAAIDRVRYNLQGGAPPWRVSPTVRTFWPATEARFAAHNSETTRPVR